MLALCYMILTHLLPLLMQLGSFHDANAPSAPVYDVGEWVGNHYPEFGYNARSPFHQWKQWAEAHLPAEEVETYKAMDTLMADDEQRSAVLKTAQFVSVWGGWA